jgi:hypothetical protein
VAQALSKGRVKSAYDHLMQDGHREGRKPNENGI